MPLGLADVSWPPIVAVSGPSGSGKTLLIEQLVPRLQVCGLRIAALKHSHHRIVTDTPGKDSDRLFRAGADVLLCGPNEIMARLHPPARPGSLWVRRLFAQHDLVLAEGFHEEPLPRISLGSQTDDRAFLSVRDPLAQADAATHAVCQWLEHTHQQRPIRYVALSHADILALLAGEKQPAGQALEVLRREAGTRLVVAPPSSEPAPLAHELLAHGGPGVDVVLPSAPEPCALLLEPSVCLMLEQAALGDPEGWRRALASTRTRRV